MFCFFLRPNSCRQFYYISWQSAQTNCKFVLDFEKFSCCKCRRRFNSLERIFGLLSGCKYCFSFDQNKNGEEPANFLVDNRKY